MIIPSELAELAIRRHRHPWNWSFHFAALWLFGLTLFSHSYLLLATTMIIAGAGFFRLDLEDPPDNRWFRFVAAAVEWEKDWVASPWNGHKCFKFIFIVCVTALLVWALWVREAATLGLLFGFALLVRVVFENMAGGIKP